MDPLLIGVLGVVVLLVALFGGVHIALALGLVGLVGSMLLKGFTGAANLATLLVYFKIAEPVFLVIPLFIFMGVLAGAGGISRDLYNTLSMWVGRFRGSLGIATVASAAAFGVVTGSSIGTATVFAKVSAPEMRRHGFDKRLAYGICASAGPIGMFIPPSVLIVFYSVLAEVSTGALLIAGIAPGLLLTVSFSIAIMIIAFLKPQLVGGKTAAVAGVTWSQRLASLIKLWPIFLSGVIIIGGIFGGIFSPSEAASWGALVIILVIIITAGSNRWKIIAKGTLDSVTMSAMIFFIIASATIFSRFLMLSGITPLALGYISELGLSNVNFLIIMTIVYLILGCFLDAVSMLSITLPVIIPVVNVMGINPIHFAMVVILAVETGLITPPVGLNVYAAKGVAESDVTIEDVFRGSFPFFIMDIVVLGILIAFPWVSTILPSLMMGS